MKKFVKFFRSPFIYIETTLFSQVFFKYLSYYLNNTWMNYLGWTSLRHELGTMNCPVAALERRAKARAFVLSLLAQKHASKRACPLGWRLQQASGKPENGKSRRAHVLCDFYDLVHCESPTPPLKSDEIATKKKGFKRTSNFLTLAYLITNTCAT